MEVIIGRDHNSCRLIVVRDGKKQLTGHPGSVPMDVSQQHASFHSEGGDVWMLRNLNPKNITFVNGIQVEQKRIIEKDKVELGASHFLVDWNIIKGPKVEYVDIRPLQRVWEEYKQTDINIRKRQKNNGILASVPMAISMFGTLVGLLMNRPGMEKFRPIAFAIAAISFCIMLIGIYRRFNDKGIDEQEENKKWLQQKYVCPKCKHFLGNEDYDILIQNDGCKHCKAKFIK